MENQEIKDHAIAIKSEKDIQKRAKLLSDFLNN